MGRLLVLAGKQSNIAGGAFLLIMLMMATGCSSGDEFAGKGEPIPEKIDFNFDVKPILSDRCFACHGPDEAAMKADLQLHIQEKAYAALGEEDEQVRHAVVPGKPDHSELYKRISSDDPEFRMPPPESNLTISDREIAILKKWIAQGAEYKKHWSFIPPEKPELPDVEDEDWPQNPIDYFVLSRMEENGMSPSPQATKEKLIRRVSFDLTGLPPTVEEVNEFVADSSEDAYEKVVDRLLASKAYGERMAAKWLDVARYADTHGYQDDGPNHMWPWRDWVIDAFNQNMPFDQFTTWQIAGDLLPDATREQKLATGFNRVHMQNQEGGIVGEEYRVEYVVDRTNTTSTAFLGLTMECARCHDHKYDPISQKEYFQFSAFFNNINEAGQIPNVGASGPTILLPDSAAEQQIQYLDAAISDQEQKVAQLMSSKNEEFAQWQDHQQSPGPFDPGTEGLVAHIDFNGISDGKVTNLASDSLDGRVKGELPEVDGKFGGALEFEKGNSINVGDIASFERTDPFSFSLWVNPSDTASGSEAPVLVKTGNIFIGYRGYDMSLLENKISVRLMHGWPYNAIQVKTLEALPLNQWSHLSVTYDGSSRAEGIQVYVNGKRWETSIHQNNLFKNIVIGQEEETYPSQPFLIGERSSFEKIEYTGLKLDELKIFDRRLSRAEILALSGSQDLPELMARAPNKRSEYQRKILFDHYLLHHDPEYNRKADKLQGLRVRKSQLTDTLREVMVMGERIRKRDTYVLKRGLYDNRGEKVKANVPKSVMSFPDDLPKNRLGLAQWLVSDENPLTARVIVNRYWQMYFGKGIVDTPGDFGNQGSLPSHPRLLDWLAVTFRESGWDVKAMQKRIVMSQTYRQSAIMTEEKLARDPSNTYLARGPRFRMTAEMIRDNALAASGLLVEQVGGPSVKPYQPEGLWKEKTSGRHLTEYIPDRGDSLYRRSLYTFWKRTSPPPFMTTFDTPGRSHTSVERGKTSTPLQALFTLNDPQFVEASRLLAERMMKEGGDSLQSQISFGFKAATSRSPQHKEVELLSELYRQELQAFQHQPSRADSLLNVGEYQLDGSLEKPELAARTIVASTILNLDETITKE
ncbi:DUF1553 domain-containing protein [Halalkalibaculum sp. DA384]|uniref:DUF1553 domain-containing protein n=1 Tax=Halalkalibaculum sp. DA384 TaxID=3373606 RepID=UPI0037552323